MPLKLLPAVPADVPDLVRTALSAFSGNPTHWPLDAVAASPEERPSNINTLFCTRDPFTDDTSWVQFVEDRSRRLFREDTDARFLKVVDEDGQMVTAARLVMYLAGAKVDEETADETVYPEVLRAGLKRDFNGGMKRKRKEIMGSRPYSKLDFHSTTDGSFFVVHVRSHLGFCVVIRIAMARKGRLMKIQNPVSLPRERNACFTSRQATDQHLVVLLASLATKPEHHRKGAGKMVLQWAADRADGARLPIYLEASEMGKPLYEKFGFGTVSILETDLEKYGGRGVDKRWLMIREPQERA
jgi:GNAT superfamily N-acetyltransferase